MLDCYGFGEGLIQSPLLATPMLLAMGGRCDRQGICRTQLVVGDDGKAASLPRCRY